MAKKTLTAFTVYAKVQVECSAEVHAASLEQAVEEARKLCELDFVDIKGGIHGR